MRRRAHDPDGCCGSGGESSRHSCSCSCEGLSGLPRGSNGWSGACPKTRGRRTGGDSRRDTAARARGPHRRGVGHVLGRDVAAAGIAAALRAGRGDRRRAREWDLRDGDSRRRGPARWRRGREGAARGPRRRAGCGAWRGTGGRSRFRYGAGAGRRRQGHGDRWGEETTRPRRRQRHLHRGSPRPGCRTAWTCRRRC